MTQNRFNHLPEEMIFWGGGGLAEAFRQTIEDHNSKLVAIFNDFLGTQTPCPGFPIYYGKEAFLDWIKGKDRRRIGFMVAIANPNGRRRLEMHHWLIDQGLQPTTIVHKTAFVADDAEIGMGTTIDATAVVGAKCKIGRQCIIGIGSVINHGSILEDAVDTTTGVVVCGDVHVGENVWLGAHCTILPRLKIGQDAVVGAGALVTKNVPSGITVVGNPAKPYTKKEK